jgi:hypothetical protein
MTPDPSKVLAALLEQKDHIFITQQVVDEVHRNKFTRAKEFVEKRARPLAEARKMQLPHGLKELIPEYGQLEKKLDQMKTDLGKLEKKLIDENATSLSKIGRSADDVSDALAKLFSVAVPADAEEMRRARERKEKGNPPGKQKDPLGDQISWEQLVARTKNISHLWLITGDDDFGEFVNDEYLLNPLLHGELTCQNPDLKVYCFDGILKGLQHFAEHSGVKAEKLPSKEQAQAIDRQLIAADFARASGSAMITTTTTPPPFPLNIGPAASGLPSLGIPTIFQSGVPFEARRNLVLYVQDIGNGNVSITTDSVPITGGPVTGFAISVPFLSTGVPEGIVRREMFDTWLANLPQGSTVRRF